MRTRTSSVSVITTNLWLVAAAAIGTLFLIACLAIVAGLIVIFAQPARAHDALPTAAQPKGWSYPTSCCSLADCREVGSTRSSSKVKVAETQAGYKISTTGEVLAFGDTRIKDSPDGEFHWCSRAGADDGETICLFAPPRGF